MQPSLAFAVVYSLPNSRHPIARYRAVVLLPVDTPDVNAAATMALAMHESNFGTLAPEDIAVVRSTPLNPPHVSTLG